MNVIDKKNQVLQTLANTNDNALIEEVYDLIHPEQAIESVQTETLPEEIRGKLEKALSDYRSGHYITHEQMKQKLQQWLTK